MIKKLFVPSLIATLCWLPFIISVTFAQTNGVPDVSTSPLPASQSEFWTFAIAIVVPLIVGGLKKLFPVIPKWALPISTPFVGLALGAALKAIGAANLGWVDMAQAGAMAVMIRESWSQLVTVPIKGEEGSKTKDPEDIETPNFRKKGRQ